MILADATINDSTSSNIQLAYNATSIVAPEDIEITVSGSGYYARANSTQKRNVNTTISDAAGVVNITIPQGTFGGGNVTLTARMTNEATDEIVATNESIVSAKSPISLEGYSVSNTTVVTGENVTVMTTLNNTADSSQDYTLAVYQRTSQGTFTLTSDRVTLSAGEKRTVIQNVSFNRVGSYDITVNDEATTEITVETPVTTTNTTIIERPAYTFQNVTVNATVTNHGDQTEETSIVLYKNGFRTQSQPVTLAAGKSKNLSFTTYLTRADTHTLRVGDGDRKRISVDSNPVEATATTVNTTSAQISDTVQTTVSLENTGDATTERIVEFNDGYQTLATKTVSPAGGERVETSYNHTVRIGGAHALTGEAYGGYQKVIVDDPAVSVDGFELASQTVYEGDRTDITVTVTNTADTTTRFTLSLWSNRSGFKRSRVIDLSAGEQKQVTLETSFFRTGDHNLTVNDQPTTTLTVEKAVSTEKVSLSKQVFEQNETFTANVTLANPTNRDRTEQVYLWTGDSRTKDVRVPAGETKNASFEVNYSSPGRHTLFVAGQQKSVVVLNDTEGTANITLDRVFTPDTAVNNSTSQIYAEAVNTGNASGVQNVTLTIDGTVADSYLVYVDANSSAPVFLEHTFQEKGDYTGTVTADESHPVNVSVRGPVVVEDSVTVEHVNGTTPTELPTVEPVFRGGKVSVQVTAGEYDYDLTEIGADQTTTFQINFSVRNYTPRIMGSTGQDLNWTTTAVGEDRTKVSIRVSPAQLDYKTEFEGERPNSPTEWDSAVTNDTADFGYNAAILLSVGTAQGEFFEADASDLNGMTISTDAQLFTMPRYFPSDGETESRLEIGLAAPHTTVDGATNDGYYRAFLPNSLLETWNVTDPESELTASYSASDSQLTVTEVEGGAYVTLSLHYSSGTVTVSKNSPSVSDSDTTSGTDSSSDSDSTSDTSGTSDTDSTTNYESQSTSTATETATATPTPTQTSTPTATATATETPVPTNSLTATPTTTATATPTATDSPATASTPETTSTSAPGFGGLVAIISLLGVALLARDSV